MKNSLIDLSPEKFVSFLKEKGIRRFYFVFDPVEKVVRSSHPELEPIAEFLRNDKRDFLEHEGLFFQVTEKFDTLQGAFIHKTNRGQAQGGIRFWHYDTLGDFLRDGLRLSVGMTRKNALAFLSWGGGKGIMVHNLSLDKQDPEIRNTLFKEYGKFVSSLRGCYVTAEDVGTTVTDMTHIHSTTRFTTCIPQSLGGSGNPSVATARGVLSGIEAALEFAGQGTLKGKTVAVQGMGHVGTALIYFLLEKEVTRVIAGDTNADLVEKRKKEFGEKNVTLKLLTPKDFWILEQACDIFSPCATGAVLNKETIPRLQCKIVCGAANNQLEDPDKDDLLLQKRGILYVPDFLVNRMGIVNCANEQFGSVTPDPIIEKHLKREWKFSIYQTALRVLKESQEKGMP
ncbi:MAG: Glu/Leu/Phe/Val dehydrogenase dimerization domain-containing protein, partial [bacterium]|nr:Glu/Leu/Phe/Val dehydrogenase dimerization domain-containing protein [bacterium]